MKLGDLVQVDEQLATEYFVQGKKIAIWSAQDMYVGDFFADQVGLVVNFDSSDEGIFIVTSSGLTGKVWKGILRIT